MLRTRTASPESLRKRRSFLTRKTERHELLVAKDIILMAWITPKCAMKETSKQRAACLCTVYCIERQDNILYLIFGRGEPTGEQQRLLYNYSLLLLFSSLPLFISFGG
jgi:hypothetical protein